MAMTGEMQVPVLVKDKQVVECPVCGQFDDLTLVMHSDDFSEDPSTMFCDDRHEWLEPRVPRRLGAELLAAKVRNSPETVVRADGEPLSEGLPRRERRRTRRRRPRR
ncbi:hypothetical protein R6V09_01120 [Streptomyces sp. W16]|uniref:hypothetical protein n=1 Tax=Streptomyces sp. W16 TaxID=3076631 RepID=UPI00295BA794|nr:hypothetical protein [Streptomyces sp. W16]MDV9168744.1 hypothetical protein [Streptomyces sp. W16]